MFVLDTNVVSAMMRPHLESEITAWVGKQDERLLFTTAVSQAEISAGLAILPDGRRRRVGRSTPAMDLMIAAIARCHGASVVTRDTGGFEGCGVQLIDPWAAP